MEQTARGPVTEMTDSIENLQVRLVAWHSSRFPEAGPEHVALKLCEEAGEVGRNVNSYAEVNDAHGYEIGSVQAECADTLIAMLVLLGRWFPDGSLLEWLEQKVEILETPGAHRASV
jgi:NTP pyrophosphatase (non-canonical NTP hydrolase)